MVCKIKKKKKVRKRTDERIRLAGASLFPAAVLSFADVRCPACWHPLVAVVGRAGPEFICGCKEKE